MQGGVCGGIEVNSSSSYNKAMLGMTGGSIDGCEADDGTVYTIIATDKAGNTSTVMVTVNDGHTFPEQWTVENWCKETSCSCTMYCVRGKNADIKL